MDKNKIVSPSGIDIERAVAVNAAEGKDEALTRALIEKCEHVYKDKFDCNTAWEMFACFSKKD